MSWNDDQEQVGRNEYLTVGPYPFAHQRDAACNKLCADGTGWYMHSSDVDRRTGHYFSIMARWVKGLESA